MSKKLPFSLSKDKSFYDSLNDWLGDLFYDEFPEKGLDCRDEQIFMSFQIEKSLKEKGVLFAEAGVGTGKTIAYLLPAIAYARYTGKPALIACADETLIDQLVKKEGDLAKLESILGWDVDVRLAKSRDQYLCLKRLEVAKSETKAAFIQRIEEKIPSFVKDIQSMQRFEPYGERSAFSSVTDEEWQQVNYQATYQCEICDVRNKCGQTLHRNYYKESADLLICSQDFLMEHLWTKDSRKREGQMPLLPEVSMLILDEGHLLEYAAQKALTYKVQRQTLLNLVELVSVDGVQEKTLVMLEDLIETHEMMFDEIEDLTADDTNERMAFSLNDGLINLMKKQVMLVESLMEEFVFEAELYVIPEFELRMTEEYLDHYLYALRLLINKNAGIHWMEITDSSETLVIMPQMVRDILKETLFSQRLPIIFSSATLSIKNDFHFFASQLGIEKYHSFHVDSPFEYDTVMSVTGHIVTQEEKFKETKRLLEHSTGGTLILFQSKDALETFQQNWNESESIRIAFEGEKELSTLIKNFQMRELDVLCSYHLWEGLDIPGNALNQVVIHELPFPPDDPVFQAKKQLSANPTEEILDPYMLLRLQQGMGRLIRTASDRGRIEFFLTPKESTYQDTIQEITPVPIRWK
ncbi:ATP-dependent DNA helicase [Paenisporosarcina cavernae]|uniref:ATP-dependent DNA helicase n=1 Tax=Paenisporosarcina cavernae TaxID=2320858 RepID=A0A385YS41_9BACL|nr:ATP-dependent DNA helicase [Paenisporosarcina cavernae]AYC29426.1 ATP-dependent DNA helicase [Paenisporosarcina cavernae]